MCIHRQYTQCFAPPPYACIIGVHDCVLGSKKLSCTGTPAAGWPSAVSSTWVVMGDLAMACMGPCRDLIRQLKCVRVSAVLFDRWVCKFRCMSNLRSKIWRLELLASVQLQLQVGGQPSKGQSAPKSNYPTIHEFFETAQRRTSCLFELWPRGWKLIQHLLWETRKDLKWKK